MALPNLTALTWQQHIASAEGPSDYTMRLVLLAISVRMLVEGRATVCVPMSEIALAAGLSRNWVMQKAREAVEAGWLQRTGPLGRGKNWRVYELSPALPVVGDLRQHVSRETVAGTDHAHGELAR